MFVRTPISTSDTAPRSHHEAVVTWICRLLAAPKIPEHAVSSVLDSLVRLLRVRENRAAFARNDGLARYALRCFVFVHCTGAVFVVVCVLVCGLLAM